MKRQQSERERLENDLHRLKQKRASMVREIRDMKKAYEKRQKEMTLKMNKLNKMLSKQKRKMDTMARKNEQIVETKARLQKKLEKKNKQLKSREDAIKKLCRRRVQMRNKRFRANKSLRQSGQHKYAAASEDYSRKYQQMCAHQERLREVQEELEQLHQTCPSSAEEGEEEEEKQTKNDENKVEELEDEANWLVVEIEDLKGKMEKELEEGVNRLQLKEARSLLIAIIRDRAGIVQSSEINAKRFATVKKQRDEAAIRAKRTEDLNRTLYHSLTSPEKIAHSNTINRYTSKEAEDEAKTYDGNEERERV